jgi:hypothetical protein
MRIVCTEQSHPPLVVTTFAEYDGGLCAMPEWAEGGSVCAISESERGSVCAVSGASSCALLGAGSWVEVPVGQTMNDRRGRLKRIYPMLGPATTHLSGPSPLGDQGRRTEFPRISYRMECRKCGLCAEARADTLNDVLSRIAEAGSEELSLSGLVSILAN